MEKITVHMDKISVHMDKIFVHMDKRFVHMECKINFIWIPYEHVTENPYGQLQKSIWIFS